MIQPDTKVKAAKGEKLPGAWEKLFKYLQHLKSGAVEAGVLSADDDAKAEWADDLGDGDDEDDGGDDSNEEEWDTGKVAPNGGYFSAQEGAAPAVPGANADGSHPAKPKEDSPGATTGGVQAQPLGAEKHNLATPRLGSTGKAGSAAKGGMCGKGVGAAMPPPTAAAVGQAMRTINQLREETEAEKIQVRQALDQRDVALKADIVAKQAENEATLYHSAQRAQRKAEAERQGSR